MIRSTAFRNTSIGGCSAPDIHASSGRVLVELIDELLAESGSTGGPPFRSSVRWSASTCREKSPPSAVKVHSEQL